MKKKLFIALALVIVCGVAALTLALAQPPASSSAAEPNEQASGSSAASGEQVSGSPADQAAATVSYQGKDIPLTQDFSLLAEDAFLQENGWQLIAGEEDSSRMIDQEAAWEAASQDLANRGAQDALPESVNMVLVQCSGLSSAPAESDAVPAWLVTVKGFDCLRSGSTTETFVSKTNLYYAIDAYSGDILEIIGQGVGE